MDLIDYFLEKDSEIKALNMDFEGLIQMNPNYIRSQAQLHLNSNRNLSQLNLNYTLDLSQLNPNFSTNLSQLNPISAPKPVET